MSAPEIFQRKINKLLAGQTHARAIMDDILIWGTDEDHDEQLAIILKIIHDSELKLNKDKCRFRQRHIGYFGSVLTAEGISVDLGKTAAINALKAPTNVAELRRVLGMVNYLGNFIPRLSSITAPMSQLLKSDVVWLLGPDQQSSFTKMKEIVTSTSVLAYYDVQKPTIVSADASSYGLGAVLLQEHKDGYHPVVFASRILSDAETRYTQIEECLASVWACEKSVTEDEVEAYVDAIKMTIPATDRQLKIIERATAEDGQLSDAIRMTKNGRPEYIKDVPDYLRSMYGVRAEFSVADGLLLYQHRVAIPAVVQSQMVDRIHDGHQGVTKCLERAKTSVWWPGITTDIKAQVASCDHCQEFQASHHKEPLMTTPLPARPWQ